MRAAKAARQRPAASITLYTQKILCWRGKRRDWARLSLPEESGCCETLVCTTFETSALYTYDWQWESLVQEVCCALVGSALARGARSSPLHNNSAKTGQHHLLTLLCLLDFVWFTESTPISTVIT